MAALVLAAALLGFSADPAIVQIKQSTDPAIVQTKQGRVRGVATSTSRRWLGIPFAAPPVGALRWQAPQPPTMWAPATRDALAFGHNCLQTGRTVDMGWPQPRSTLSEDCLTLNVYAGPAAAADKPVPVLFWIYGGGFQGGGGNETRLNGTWDAALLAGELVLVTSNYRLDAFGFAASAALSERESKLAGERRGTGNYGILDQRAALRWVSENIGAFGGDASRLLIVGQSAGASSVSQHLVRPASWGLFSAAGMESGAFYDGKATPTVADRKPAWDKYVAAAGCAEAADAAACLVALPADALLNLTARKGGWGGQWDNPVVDGVDLLAPGPELAAQGWIAKVPIFAGGCSDDINVFEGRCKGDRCGRANFEAVARRYGFDEAQAEALAGLYAADGAPADDATTDAAVDWSRAIAHAGADAWANCPARRVARWYAAAKQPAWWYLWSYVPLGPNGAAGAHHAVEQPFVFHVLNETVEQRKEDGGVYHIDPSEAPFSARLVRAWAAMAATGDPNAPGHDGVGWPPFGASANGSALLIEGSGARGAAFRAAANYMGGKCDLFDAAFEAAGARLPIRTPRPGEW